MKICIVCSAGGHLTEISQLREVFRKYDYFFLTAKRKDTKDLAKSEKVIFITDPGRSPLRLLKNICQSILVIRKENPDVILSTGAGIAIPTCYIAKMLGKKVVFLESVCRINNPSLSGKLAYPIADLFLVPRKSLLSKYGKKSKYWGAVI